MRGRVVMRRLAGILFLLLCISLLHVPGRIAQAEELDSTAEQSQRFITIDFEDVDINLFIKYISELTGKNFIVDKTVKGNVTIVSPTKISEEEAYRVFESVLDVNGYTTVESGAVTKIIPSVKARTQNIHTFRSDLAQHPEDRMVTQLIPLKYTTPDEVKKVLAPLVSKTSVVIAHTQSGMLIVTDTLSNIQRLLAIIDAIDVAYTGEETLVLPLEHAAAEDASKVLLSLFQQSRTTTKKAAAVAGQSSDVKIVPYERINALIIVATPSDIERIQKLVKVLDAEMKRSSGNIHVYYLQNADATELAKVLNFLPGQESQQNTKEKSNTPSISKSVKIMADEETNSLVITATKSEYQVLEEVIQKLDIPRRMVYLEALIMEVNTSKNFNVGVEWALGGSTSDGTKTVTSGFTSDTDSPYSTLSSVGESSPATVSGFSLGVIAEGIKIGGITFPNIGAVLTAYKNDSDINIISTPQILTTDNKEAEISVGENVPYITSQNTSSSDEDYTSYEYKDVSTKLTITPHINQAETLRLEIATEVIKLKSDDTSLTPTTLKRTATTTVIVQNNETVVLGGIIGQDTTLSNTRIPLLGDIPILGRLFRSDAEDREKTNMFIFITPKIIKNPADIASVTMDKTDEMEKTMPEAKSKVFKEVNAGHAMRLCERGFDKMKAGRNDDARDFFLEALQIDEGNPYALYNLGVIAEEAKDFDEAKKRYKEVIASGTSMTAAQSEDASEQGLPLLELARERLENLNHPGDSEESREDKIFRNSDVK